MRVMLDWQTAQELVDRRVRALERAKAEHELSDTDADELAKLYVLRERLQRASVQAVEAALDELGVEA